MARRRQPIEITNVEVVDHPRTLAGADLAHRRGKLWLAIVTTNHGGRYGCAFTGDKPTEEAVRDLWREDPKSFDRYAARRKRKGDEG